MYMHVLPPELRMRLDCGGLPTWPQAMSARSAQWQDLKQCTVLLFTPKGDVVLLDLLD